MRIQNTFVRSKMNKDIDERLLVKGEYVHGENIRVIDSGASHMGAIENSLGTEQLTSFVFNNAMTIGSFVDSSNQKIYAFITSDTKDLVIEYDDFNGTTKILLESSKPGVLNFSKNYLITGVNKVVNGDSSKDLLAWTDDLNPPRIVNIERAQTYGANGFVEEDISVIKNPPEFSPIVTLTYTTSTLENNMRERFLSFAYRYKYLDGEYSALSSFQYYAFSPGEFRLNYQTMENEGMVNDFNAVSIKFNTGSKRVTDIELVYKETNSVTVNLIESFNKKEEGWGDNEEQSYLFSNNKSYTVLAEDELFRTYDKVPRLSKAQEFIGNRLMYGNYLEDYDLVDMFGEEINIDYNVSLQTNDLSGIPVPFVITDGDFNNDVISINLTGIPLNSGTRLVFSFVMEEATYNDGAFTGSFNFILNADYASVADLAASEEFLTFVNTIITNAFMQSYVANPPDDSELLSNTNFTVTPIGDFISIKALNLLYQIDNTPANPADDDFRTETSYWRFLPTSSISFKTSAVDSSLKTNRDYEACIMYRDGQGRLSPALPAANNTIYIPQEFSTSQNRLRVSINHKAPAWAKSYKIVVKQNKGQYQTIYVNRFYEDGVFRYIKIEGANKDKIHEGDTLIVKSDLGGVVEDVIRVRVLEVINQEKDFIDGNENEAGQPILEEQGLYAKIRPIGFDMNFSDATAQTFEGSSHLRYPVNTYTSPDFGTTDTGVFTPYPLNAGSKVRIFIEFTARGSIAYQATYDKEFVVASDYNSVEEWFNTEVGDLGEFGDEFTRGYGFDTDGKSFYVRAHRDGTASRNITTIVRFDILFTEGIVIFETEPEDLPEGIFFESAETFLIDGVNHSGNIQDQDVLAGDAAIVEIGMFNCYVMGNGAESYRVRDALNARYLNIDYRPTSTIIPEYAAIRRFVDITYSELYNENNGINGLNEFNLFRANFKDDLDKRYGSIQKLYASDTDLIVFQEDKVSRVLYGKDLIMNANGTYNVSSIDSILGQQVPFAGEYGISKNPESFAVFGNSIYWLDSKRGVPLKLGGSGIIEKNYGLSNWFRDEFKDSLYTRKLGAYDPYDEHYVISVGGVNVNPNLEIDCSETLVRRHFIGEQVIEVDYGILTGTAGFTMTTNGVPVKYSVMWGDTLLANSGYVGDPSYNAELAALGLPPVVAPGNVNFTFSKTTPFPPSIKVILSAPIEGLTFDFSGVCIVAPSLTVINVVSNDDTFQGLTIDNRYKWVNSGYSSSYMHNYTQFTEGAVSIYQPLTGMRGTGFIPSVGSTILMEAFNGFNETAAFNIGGSFKYLLSNTLYTEADIVALLAAANPLTATQVPLGGGDVLHKASFTVPNLNFQYLYLIWDYKRLEITPETRIRIYFDSSGSMNSTLAPLQEMRDTILKDALLPLYNNDPDLYDERVQVISWSNERTLQVLNLQGDTPPGNVIAIVFQDEAENIYHTSSSITPRTSAYNADIATFRARLAAFPTNYYRGVVFQVDGFPMFKTLMKAVENGTGDYNGSNGLVDRDEVIFRYDTNDGDTPQYYLDKIVQALEDLGYEL